MCAQLYPTLNNVSGHTEALEMSVGLNGADFTLMARSRFDQDVTLGGSIYSD